MKPLPTTWTSRKLHTENTCVPIFGIEIEVDVPSGYRFGDSSFYEPHAELCALLGAIDTDIYIQGDNSLSEFGIEIVSTPHSLQSHKKNLPWDKILSATREYGYAAESSEFACGLHIHVNRKSLGFDETQQTTTIKRLLFIIHKCWIDFTKVSGRRAGLIQTWSRKYNVDLTENLDKIYADVIVENNSENGRRRVINFRNKDTIGFRLFNSTQNENTLFKRIELIENLVKFTRGTFCLSDSEFVGSFECRQISDLLFS